MRLLFLTSRLPYPPDRGDRLRTYHLLRQLSEEHAITLVSFVVTETEAQWKSQLAPFCEEIHLVVRSKKRSQLTAAANFWRKLPMQALYYRAAEMQRLVDRLLAKGGFDAVYVHLFRMAPFVYGKCGLYRIVDLTDMISSEIEASMPYRSPLSRLIYHLERPRIASYERQVAGWAEETWLISERDRALLAKSIPSANLRLVPNGVDLERFRPITGRSSSKRLLFVGHLDVFHNMDAASYLVKEIFPLVRRRVPECTLDIVGPGTGFRLADHERIQGIQMRGFVPDLNQVLNEAAVFVAPLRFSAGVQNKVLEAMAAGLPVVTTRNVSEGLGAHPGEELLVGSEPDELAEAIVGLLEDAAQRRQLGLAGREFVKGRFSWQVAGDRLRRIERKLKSGG